MSGPAVFNNRYINRVQPVSGVAPIVGDALLAVANIAALIALDDTTIDDGGVVAVKSMMDLWMLDKTSPLVPDGITVVAAPTAGNWVRMKLPNLTWQKQTTWYINESLGNDENDGGTIVTPLATFEEFSRRVGRGPIDVAMTVNFDSTLAQDIEVGVLTDELNGQLTLQGVQSAPLYSGSFTAVIGQNALANQDLQVTDAAIPVSWLASGLVDKLCVLTSGPNAGASAQVVKSMAAKAARITKFYNETAGTYVEPAPGDTFDVVDLGLVEGALLGIAGGAVRVAVRDLRFLTGSTPVHESYGGLWSFVRCDLDGGSIDLGSVAQRDSSSEGASFIATRLRTTERMTVSRTTCNLSAVHLAMGITVVDAGRIVILHDCISQHSATGLDTAALNSQAQSSLHCVADSSFGVFDWPNPVERAAVLASGAYQKWTGLLWGYGNTFDYAIELGPGTTFEYAVGFNPIVSAAVVNDTIIAGLPRSYAVIPSTNVQKLAGIIRT